MIALNSEMVLSKSKAKDLNSVKKLNCWASNLNDVSILKEMPNLEILTLSVNGISSLKDIQHCKNLSELYIRNNNINDLNEIFYLKNLKNLKILWLADNECVLSSNDSNYRLTVLRNLPNLQKLDNQLVTREELDRALELGQLIEKPNLLDTNKLNNDMNKFLMPLTDDLKALISSIEECEYNDDSLKPKEIVNRNETMLEEPNFTNKISNDVLDQNIIEINIDEAKEELGFKPLEISRNKKCDLNSSNNSNILTAILLLINDLNIEELGSVIQACHKRKCSLLNTEVS